VAAGSPDPNDLRTPLLRGGADRNISAQITILCFNITGGKQTYEY
jgi:hypothetical protein